MTRQRLQVQRHETGRPLSAFLAERLGVSQRQSKALLDQRRVFVNQRRVWMARHAVRAGDDIDILPPPAGRPDKPDAWPVLYEDANYLLIDKPPGLPTTGPDSVETRLRRLLAPQPVRAVHRLDRDTSGCLLFARGDAAFERATVCFRQRRVIKVYQAIVSGAVSEEASVINRRLDGREALTHLRVLDTNRLASHLRLRIETGRTHQIRKHLAGIGHPVIGDKEYRTGRIDDDRLRLAPRQMLHAARFEAPLGANAAPIRATAMLPKDFRESLKRLDLH